MTFEEWWDQRFASDADDMGLAFEAFSAGRESMKAEAIKVVPEKWNSLDLEKRKYRRWTLTDLLYELGFQPLDAIEELEP